MRQEKLREVLLVKAIEEADRSGVILPFADRERAARDALRANQLGTEEIARDAAAAKVGQALSERAAVLVRPLLERHPVLEDLLARSGWPAWIGLALLVVAAASGYGLSAMNDSRRINILALPFLGLIAWNLLVYLWLAMGGVRRIMAGATAATRLAGSAARGIGRRLGPLVARTVRVDKDLGAAVRRFVADWSDAGAPVLAQQARLWLHLAAAAVAVGLIVGLYQRGIGHHFVAGWESTWLTAPGVQWVIDTLFGPVASWSGIELPRSVEEVRQLEFLPDGAGGGTAAPWIHLIALCLMCMVVLPRLVLAGVAWFGSERLQRAARLPGSVAAYARAALGAGGQGLQTVINVLPYAFEPPPQCVAGLEPVLQEMFGRGARPRLQSPIAYGDEDSLRTAIEQRAQETDGFIILMSLASTPEVENHGVVISAARDSARAPSVGAAFRLVIDGSSYASRFAADPSLAGRMEERRQLWRKFARGYGIEATFMPASKA
jgi:hypothetical protein